MMLQFADGTPFSHGASRYLYQPAVEGEESLRIFVPIRIGEQRTIAALDTGGAYFVCDPELAAGMGLDAATALMTRGLRVRGMRYEGALHRESLTLVAEKGQSVPIEVTVFVPHLTPGQEWHLPSFLGLHGCLERLRFAVDPGAEMFYFGSPAYDL